VRANLRGASHCFHCRDGTALKHALHRHLEHQVRIWRDVLACALPPIAQMRWYLQHASAIRAIAVINFLSLVSQILAKTNEVHVKTFLTHQQSPHTAFTHAFAALVPALDHFPHSQAEIEIGGAVKFFVAVLQREASAKNDRRKEPGGGDAGSNARVSKNAPLARLCTRQRSSCLLKQLDPCQP